jgi:hypothetical protein
MLFSRSFLGELYLTCIIFALFKILFSFLRFLYLNLSRLFPVELFEPFFGGGFIFMTRL